MYTVTVGSSVTFTTYDVRVALNVFNRAADTNQSCVLWRPNGTVMLQHTGGRA